MVKLIAIDLDGTLLNEESQISKGNLEAIKHAQANGIEVVIATGRAQFDVQTIFNKTGLNTWIIGTNGATIHQPNGELFHSVLINRQDAIHILNWLEEEEYYYEIFTNHAIFTPQNGRELITIEMDRAISANPDVSTEQLIKAAEKQYSQSGFSFISSYKEIIDTDIDVYNILAFSFDKDKLQKGKEKFKGMKDVTMVTSAMHNFELEHKNASKGIALEILAKKLKINIADTAAVGDSFNDLSMLRIAGRSAAMGNAPEEIKNVCQEVTLSNTDDGVAHFIHSLLRSPLSSLS
ncbi:HAD family phosphatase [Neobacillus notoginsengisoli]|uniref:HAD family phosphatase n=1 Tax=Neobacillus notoginsengisoli TaxID=1578198 RepID=A0A417YRF5_9BACI|nr:Cof-type HAD-IIB family hydrolase [Neobacillus notoginsengisoli]RHW37991.1 HAD family phosphatase [Neobacillus notoginsengisoli]